MQTLFIICWYVFAIVSPLFPFTFVRLRGWWCFSSARHQWWETVYIIYQCYSFLTLTATKECVREEHEQQSRCIELNNCDWAKELLRKNQFPQTCGFNGTEPKVCCPIAAKVRLKQFGNLAENGLLILFN